MFFVYPQQESNCIDFAQGKVYDYRKSMSEKWNYKLYLTGSESPEKEAVRKSFQEESTAEIYNVRDLKRTKVEKQAIDTALTSTEQAIVDLGLTCPAINQESIHIVTAKEFETKVDPESRGLTSFGNIYIIRDSNYPRFIHDLTHELSHLVSFYALNVKHSYDEENKKGQNEVGLRKSGFSFIPKAGQSDPHFNGLDEAVTEMFAQKIREKYIQSRPELKDETKEFLVKKIVYWSHIMVIDQVISAITSNDEEYKQMEQDFFRDKITGESKVLKKISLYNKEWIKILYTMGSSDEDARNAAMQMGFTELAKKIEEYMNEDSSP